MRSKLKFSKKIFFFFALILIITGSAVVYFEVKYSDRFYPGIFIDGKAVGGKKYLEVLDLYKIGSDALSKDGISINIQGENGGRKINIPMTASGMSPDRVVEYFSLGDWESPLREAFNYGKTGSVSTQATKQASLFFRKKVFDFPAAFQNEAIRSFYTREMKGYLKEVIPAEFIYKNNKVDISQEKAGEEIDYNKVTEEINKKLSSFDSTPISLKTKTVTSETTKEKLTLYLPVAKEMTKGINLVFKYKDYEWRVNGKKLITWLKINEDGRLAIDSKKLEDFLYKNIIPIIDNPPQSSRFEIKDGVLTEVMPGKPGNMVDVGKTVAIVEEAVFGIKRSVGLADSLLASLGNISANDITIENGAIVIPIAITEAEPKITKDTVSEYEIKELSGIATTNFKGSSADRIHNIKVGVSKLTGILIAPGEEFSAVTSIGATTEEEGFVKEFVIKENKSVKEFGGGLCQIATTLFRLALNAGLPITERTNHRYVVGYYGPGLDATIYEPHPDLRFVNDTGQYLLLQGKVENNELTFELFGQKDERVVTISNPILSDEKPAPATKYLMSPEVPYATMQCSETPRKGVTAEVTYTVNYREGKINEQKFKSVYQPWAKICLIGLGTSTSTLPK